MRKHDMINLTPAQFTLVKRLFVELEISGWAGVAERFDADEVRAALVNLVATNEILSRPALGVVK